MIIPASIWGLPVTVIGPQAFANKTSVTSATIPAMAAGRIAYQLDLRGAAMVVDTSCSSSLVAVHEACAKVAGGEATYAIAGGIRLNAVFEADYAGARAVDVLAPDGRTKAFDAKADGTGIGEGGALVLLKRLDRAVRDRDHIYAVIRGNGPLNKERVALRRMSYEQGEWVRRAVLGQACGLPLGRN